MTNVILTEQRKRALETQAREGRKLAWREVWGQAERAAGQKAGGADLL